MNRFTKVGDPLGKSNSGKLEVHPDALKNVENAQSFIQYVEANSVKYTDEWGYENPLCQVEPHYSDGSSKEITAFRIPYGKIGERKGVFVVDVNQGSYAFKDELRSVKDSLESNRMLM